MTLRIAVLISGTGSNLRAILEAIEQGRCDAEVCAVLSDRQKAPGLQLARERAIPVTVVGLKSHPDREAWDRALAQEVGRLEIDLVVLAGFMKIVGRAMVGRFRDRIINVHPSLLPLFPGVDGPAQAVAAGVRVSGCTVHLVDDGVDSGKILAQAAVAVRASDDAAALHRRIQAAEHRLLPAVIDAIAAGRLLAAAGEIEEHDDSALYAPAAALFPSGTPR